MSLQAENAMLRQELSKAHEDLANLESNLDHIMNMVRRTLMGDSLAGEYLANITGVSAVQPENTYRTENIYPSSQMNQFNGETDSHSSNKLEDRVTYLNNALDEHFGQFESNSNQKKSPGTPYTNGKSNLRRTNSASSLDSRRSKSKDLCVGDLILEKERKQANANQLVTFSPADTTTPLQSLQNKKKYEPIKHPYLRMTEQDGALPNGHLFNANDVVPRKRHSISSAELKKSDEQRSKPRSGNVRNASDRTDSADKPCSSSVFMSGRPMKYEVVNPNSCINAASAKPPSGRITSAPNAAFGRTTRVPILAAIPTSKIHSTPKSETDSPPHENSYSDANSCFLTPVKKKKNEVGRLYPLRPACIDDFSKEMDSLHDLETKFEKTAINLQKKLGIGSDGIVLP